MTAHVVRRRFIQTMAAGSCFLAAGPQVTLGEKKQTASANESPAARHRYFKTLKWGMIQLPGKSTEEIFRSLAEFGFDGVELDSPNGLNKAEAMAASAKTGFPIDGTVDSLHWEVRITDRDPSVRQKGFENLVTALRETRQVGGHTVLLVPGHGDDGPKDVIWPLAIEQIQKAIPYAALYGVAIAIENVWNKMFYDHDGPANQTADQLAEFVDHFNSPWVGVQFDIGNHQKYGSPAAWIRTLGKRIIKLDVKDWGISNGFCKIGEGDVDWADVRKALQEIGYSGWAAAEVSGGGEPELREIAHQMDTVLAI